MESADYYANRILVASRKKPEEERKKDREFVAKTKALLRGLRDYVKEYFPKKLEWKTGGLDVTLFKPSHQPTTINTNSQLTGLERLEIGRAVQQECRDRSRMPSSA
eukprot:TRINITY_DN89204_c0_g1_i3.p1 TRINITY_DN89204_c0_g1~~TRINITY_DN89204_c0_g1_i3.p1  ORF type:complete len:106 (-),score=18.49 TRINITY_DN89204_c0_g1_i3:10-327(-)